MCLLEADGVSKRFGGILALKNMHFAASAGEVHAILGENGAGKSTFIQILSGAVAADRGRDPPARRAPIGRGTRARRAVPASRRSSRNCR